MALSVLLHAAAGVGATAVAGHAVRGASRPDAVDDEPLEIALSSSIPSTSLLEDSVEIGWTSEVRPLGGDLPEAAAFELPIDLSQTSLAPADEPVEPVDIDLGFEHCSLLDHEIPPLDALHRPQPPPVILAEAEYTRPIAPGLGVAAPGGAGGSGGGPGSNAGGSGSHEGRGGRSGERAGVGSGGRAGGRGGGGLLGGDLVVGGKGGSWPDLIDGPPPEYPAKARLRGWEGTVVVRILVGANGLVSAVSVEGSSGYEILDQAAVAAVRSWRFHPARRGGVPAPAEILHRVTFRLADPAPR